MLHSPFPSSSVRLLSCGLFVLLSTWAPPVLAQSPSIIWADRRINVSMLAPPVDPWVFPLSDGRIVVKTGWSLQTWDRQGRLLQAIGDLQSMRPMWGESTSPDGRIHLLVDNDLSVIHVLDAGDGASIGTLPIASSTTLPRAHFAHDGSFFVIFHDGRIDAYLSDNLEKLWSVQSGVTSPARFTHDNASFIYTDGGVITMRSSETGRIERRFTGLTNPVDVGFGDSSRLVVAYTGCWLFRWNAESAELIDSTFDRASCPRHRMTFDRDGRRAITYGTRGREGDSTIRVWTPDNALRINDFGGVTLTSAIAVLTTSPDGREAIVLTTNGVLTPIRLETGEAGEAFPRPFRALVTSPVGPESGATVAVAGALAHLYDSSGRYLRPIGPMKNNLLAPLSVTKDGSLYAALDWDLRAAWLFDSTGAMRGSAGTNSNGFPELTTTAVSPTGSVFAVSDTSIRIYSVPGVERVGTIAVPRQVISTLAFSGDGRLLAAGLGNGSYILWDVATLREVHRHRHSSGRIVDIELGRDGSRVIALHQNRNVSVSSVADSTGYVRQLRGDSVVSIALSTNGRVLVAGGDSIYLYSLPSLEPLGAFADSLDYMRQGYRVGFIPELGIVSSSTDGDLIRWSSSGMPVALGVQTPPERPTAPIVVAIDGDRLRVSCECIGTASRIELHDALGRYVHAAPIDRGRGAEISLDLTGIPRGVYVVSIVDERGERTSATALRP